MGAVVPRDTYAGLGDDVSENVDKLRLNARYGKAAGRITVIDPHDAEVIRDALAVYVEWRVKTFKAAAGGASVEEQLRLTREMMDDQDYVAGLIRAVGDGTLVASTGPAGPQSDETESSDE